MWYCVVVLVLLGFSLLGVMFDALKPSASRPSAYGLTVDLVSDGLYIVLHVVGLVYFRREGRTREQVVRTFTWGMVLVGATAILTTPLIDNTSLVEGARAGEKGTPAILQQFVTVFTIFVLHALASLLVSLSPREGLRILVPLVVLYAVSLVVNTDVPWGNKAVLILIACVAGLPGFAWSWWRHSGFTEQFLSRAASRPDIGSCRAN